jgi:tRNA(Ile)-lysidine synthase
VTLASATVERFRRDLERLTGAAPSAGDLLGLAVSGGPDSMALLLLAAAAYPGAVRAATVNHGLRPEAADEAAMVARTCDRLGVPHVTLSPPPGHAFIGNVQDRARALRYTALRHWAVSLPLRWIAVAHQRDDVAETLLMRARRGSGVGGLAAMPRSRPLDACIDDVQLIRPLLDWARTELEGLLACHGIPAAVDRSNADPRYDRSRMRALIAASPELVPSRLALSAQNLRHAEDAIAWAAAREYERFRTGDKGTVEFDSAGLPYELRRRLARHAVQHVRDANGWTADWYDKGLDRLVATLDQGGTGTIAEVIARARASIWRFELAPPRRSH